MENTIKIQKGQQASKLLLMRELMQGLEDLFESVDNPEADPSVKFFGGGKMSIATESFEATLIIKPSVVE